MELDAISVAPWVGHVVVPDARINDFAYEWVWLHGEEGCLLAHRCSPKLSMTGGVFLIIGEYVIEVWQAISVCGHT